MNDLIQKMKEGAKKEDKKFLISLDYEREHQEISYSKLWESVRAYVDEGLDIV